MEFKGILVDRVVQHVVDFLKGVGYMEASVFEAMRDLSEEYFSSLEPETFCFPWDDTKVMQDVSFDSLESVTIPLQQDDLKVD